MLDKSQVLWDDKNPNSNIKTNAGGALHILHLWPAILTVAALVGMNCLYQESGRRRFERTFGFLPKRYALLGFRATRYTESEDDEKKVGKKLTELHRPYEKAEELLKIARRTIQESFSEFVYEEAKLLEDKRAYARDIAHAEFKRAKRIADRFGYGNTWDAKEANKLLRVVVA